MNTNRLVRGRTEERKRERERERERENFAFGKIVNPENISKQITLPFLGTFLRLKSANKHEFLNFFSEKIFFFSLSRNEERKIKKKEISIFPKLLQHFLVRKINPDDWKSGFKERERKRERKREREKERVFGS